MKPVQLIEVKSELGAGTRGASLGIDAMKIAALNAESTYFKTHESIHIDTENEMLLDGTDTKWAKRAKGVVKVYERICYELSNVLNASESFPIVLAGDHSTAGGTIAGIKKAYPDKELGVIWVDAHADLHTPYTTPSGNIHGMPLATALGEDNMEKQCNEVKEITRELWEQLKNTGGVVPKVKPENIVFVAVRSTEEGEDHLLAKHSIKNHTVEDVREKGVEHIVQNVLSQLETCDLIYVSFDVDSMDPEISRGTGTPVENGLTVQEAEGLLLGILESEKVCCFEIVEVNPTLDNKCNAMADTAFAILEKATNLITNKTQVTL